jgi:Lamin Tail Domain/CHU_C Type IX secretion signal domain/Bacterial Ig-like domain
MHIYLTVLLLVVNTLVWGQFSDDFEDGDFTSNPTWSGQDANFMITAGELQLNAPAVTDTSYLSVPTTLIDNVTWDIYVRMEFNPSSSNYTRVYLVSDNADLKASLNGYFVMVGNTSDEISLYRQDGITTTEIIDGLDDAVDLTSAIARLRVTRDASGNWELMRDTLGGYNFFSEGTVNDNTYTSTTNFGVFCKYTSTRSDLFFFDNAGDPYLDTTIPTIVSSTAISSTELDVMFSEPVDQITAETASNYSVDGGIGVPSTSILDGGDPSLVHLTFATPFTNGSSYVLTANNVEDVNGNSIANPSTSNFTYFVPEVPAANDVIITEFVADPSPAVGLPEVEFVEIYNRSAKIFDLTNWTISDASGSGTLPSYTLLPGEYLLITNTGDAAQFFVSNYVEVSLPSLNNSDDAVVIKDDLGTVLDSIYYTTDWYTDPDKDAGGWSLERKHLDAPCNDMSNWSAAVNLVGGTPAEQNSNWTDQDDVTAPTILSYEVVSDMQVNITMNELLDTTASLSGQFIPAVTSSQFSYIDESTIQTDVMTLQPNVSYELQISGAADCWGNLMGTESIFFGLPDSIEAGDLILNEVMFNPLTNGSDYVELYNNSDKILDLQEVYLANWDDDSIANYKAVSDVQRLLLPAEYALITEDTNDITNDFLQFHSSAFIEADLPTYPNDSGTVYVLSKDALILDYFHYDEDFHFNLLSTEDGKSLERISFDGEMNNPDNWHTAAEDVEWGTPGYENSQQFNPNVSGSVSVDPQMFSPDSDGYNDVLTINLDLSTNENVVDVEIFDNHGRLIRLLKDNFFAGNTASFTWDGINDRGEKALIGTYVILISITDSEGNLAQFKEVAVLAGQL